MFSVKEFALTAATPGNQILIGIYVGRRTIEFHPFYVLHLAASNLVSKPISPGRNCTLTSTS